MACLLQIHPGSLSGVIFDYISVYNGIPHRVYLEEGRLIVTALPGYVSSIYFLLICEFSGFLEAYHIFLCFSLFSIVIETTPYEEFYMILSLISCASQCDVYSIFRYNYSIRRFRIVYCVFKY